MTDGDAEARHFELLRMLARPGGPLRTDAPTSTMRNPAWWDGPTPSDGRQLHHERLREAAWAEAGPVTQGHRAIVLAGPPGAGKGTMRREVLAEQQGRFLVVDADDFKKALLIEAIRDGSYESWITPPAVRGLEARGERFYPMEMAALVHEESSRLARDFRRDAIGRSDDLVIDTVLGDPEAAVQLGRDLEAARYDIRVIHVATPPAVSAERVRSRWAEGYREAIAGRDPLGGRVVESEVLRRAATDRDGEPITRLSARRLTHEVGAVRSFQDHWTPSESAPRQLVVDLGRVAPGAELTHRTPGTEAPSSSSRPTTGLSPAGHSAGLAPARAEALERSVVDQAASSSGGGRGAGSPGGRTAGPGLGR